jgi:CheY-like chemotaxis protein
MAQILVVDDEAQIRKLIRLVLQQENHMVAEASNGKKAIQHIQDAEINLIIADIVMPDMDGLELIREIRKIHPEIKILAISGAGRGGPELYLKLAEHIGADAVLQKPFTPQQLSEKVSGLIA